MTLKNDFCGILAEYNNENSLNIIGNFKITILCFEVKKETTAFAESLWLNYNKTVRNSSIDDFNYLEIGSIIKIAYWDNKEKTVSVDRLRIYDNHVGFFNDVSNSNSLQNSFRYEYIENCDISFKKPNNIEYNKLYHKKCCLGFTVIWPGDFVKKIDICSINKHNAICIVEIRNLEKTLGNNCKKFIANKKIYEMNQGQTYSKTANCSLNSNNSQNSSNKFSPSTNIIFSNKNNVENKGISSQTLIVKASKFY